MGWKGRIGDYLDSETGLIYMRARYYAPSLGRFITRDPIGWTCGPNLYAYCFGDPVDFFDADGLRGQSILQALNGWTPWGMAYRMGVGFYNDPKGFLINMIPFVGLYHADEAFGYTYGMWESGKASAGDLLDAGLGCAISNAGTAALMFGGVSAVTGGGGAAEVGAGGIGDLTAEESAAIQNLTNDAGRPIHVVGSAARGARRGVGSGLPFGKGPGTRSDIDYLIGHSSWDHWQDLYHRLPGMDPAHGPIGGTPNPFMGPSITFDP